MIDSIYKLSKSLVLLCIVWLFITTVLYFLQHPGKEPMDAFYNIHNVVTLR